MIDKHRDYLGKMVRDICMKFLAEKADRLGIANSPDNLIEYENIPDENKELFRQIGEELYTIGYRRGQADLEARALQTTLRGLMGL